MNPQNKALVHTSLLLIGIVLFALWGFVVVVWIAMYSWHASYIVPERRILPDTLIWIMVLLNIAAVCAALWIRQSGLSIVRALALIAWIFITPLTFALDGADNSSDIPQLLAKMIETAIASPIFPGLYLLGLLALLIMAGIYPYGPGVARPTAR